MKNIHSDFKPAGGKWNSTIISIFEIMMKRKIHVVNLGTLPASLTGITQAIHQLNKIDTKSLTVKMAKDAVNKLAGRES